MLAACHSASGWTEIHDLSKLSDLRAEAGNLLWAEADVVHLSEDIGVIADEFGLAPLAVEDALNTRQRPKIESYDTHRFVVFHQLDEVDGQLEASQIACFVGDGYLLTIHAGADRTIDEAKKRWERQRDSALFDRPEGLLYTLFDVVVDDYQRFADQLEDRVEELEEIALNTPEASMQHQLYSMKQQLSRFRRFALPAVRLVEQESDLIDEQTAPDQTQLLFRDVYDHLVRMKEQIHNVDELVQAVLDLNHSALAIRLNEVNKRLTAWAAIFAIGTLITGVYGMNFVLVPKDQTLFGFWFAIGLLAVSATSLVWYFRRRGWL